MAFSARGRSPANWLTNRDTAGSDATGLASSGCSPQDGDVGQAVAAQGDGGGQVRDGLAQVVDGPRRPPPGQALRQARLRPVTPSSPTAGPRPPGTPVPFRPKTP
jgi:hypothetical protein